MSRLVYLSTLLVLSLQAMGASVPRSLTPRAQSIIPSYPGCQYRDPTCEGEVSDSACCDADNCRFERIGGTCIPIYTFENGCTAREASCESHTYAGAPCCQFDNCHYELDPDSQICMPTLEPAAGQSSLNSTLEQRQLPGRKRCVVFEQGHDGFNFGRLYPTEIYNKGGKEACYEWGCNWNHESSMESSIVHWWNGWQTVQVKAKAAGTYGGYGMRDSAISAIDGAVRENLKKKKSIATQWTTQWTGSSFYIVYGFDVDESEDCGNLAGRHPHESLGIGCYIDGGKTSNFDLCHFGADLVGALAGVLNPWAGIAVTTSLIIVCDVNGQRQATTHDMGAREA